MVLETIKYKYYLQKDLNSSMGAINDIKEVKNYVICQ